MVLVKCRLNEFANEDSLELILLILLTCSTEQDLVAFLVPHAFD
jgi:hypothetical protein